MSPPGLKLLEFQRPLARYFSSFVLDNGGADCYSKLLNSLKDAGKLAHAVFGSLNYECLFEQAAENLGLIVDYQCCDTKPDTVCVAKLHGSCNFVTDELTQASRAILASTNTLLEIRFTPLPLADLERTLARKIATTGNHFPVMSQVSKYKEHYVSPAAIQKIRNVWNEALLKVKFVVIVGVSFNCHDSHIIEPIEQSPGLLLYVGDAASFKKWSAVHPHAKQIGGRFEDAFPDLLKELAG